MALLHRHEAGPLRPGSPYLSDSAISAHLSSALESPHAEPDLQMTRVRGSIFQAAVLDDAPPKARLPMSQQQKKKKRTDQNYSKHLRDESKKETHQTVRARVMLHDHGPRCEAVQEPSLMMPVS